VASPKPLTVPQATVFLALAQLEGLRTDAVLYRVWKAANAARAVETPLSRHSVAKALSSLERLRLVLRVQRPVDLVHGREITDVFSLVHGSSFAAKSEEAQLVVEFHRRLVRAAGTRPPGMGLLRGARAR